MSDLCSGAVEAIARSRYEFIGGVKWEECPAPELWLEDAAHDLDALLVFLGEHTVPMYRVSALAQEWVVCDPADADAFVIDLAVLGSGEGG
jgi:hypothetical protein